MNARRPPCGPEPAPAAAGRASNNLALERRIPA